MNNEIITTNMLVYYLDPMKDEKWSINHDSARYLLSKISLDLLQKTMTTPTKMVNLQTLVCNLLKQYEGLYKYKDCISEEIKPNERIDRLGEKIGEVFSIVYPNLKNPPAFLRYDLESHLALLNHWEEKLKNV